MSILSGMRIGWGYVWWFTAAYALITLSTVLIYGKAFSKRFFRLPLAETIKPKLSVLIGATLFGRVLMIYSIFVPLQLNTA